MEALSARHLATCSAAIINVDEFIDDFIPLWYESLYG